MKPTSWYSQNGNGQPGFLPCLEKPKWWYKTDSWYSILRVFFRFAPMGKVEKTRFERNWTTFVNPAFCPAWKSQNGGMKATSGIKPTSWYSNDGESRKNAVWTQLDDVRQPGFLPCLEKPTENGGIKPTTWNSIPRVLFRFAPMGKVEKRVLNAIGRRSSTRLFALLGKAHSKWWYETDLVVFDPKGVFSFRPDGESRKNAFWTQLDDVCQPGFLPCLEKPTQNGGMKPTSWYSILRVFFRFAPMGKVEKTRFGRNWTTFVNPAFCPAWKSPLKMVVWNRPRGIRSQGCCFVSPRWGKSKNAFWTQLDDVRQPGFLPCLEKPTQNGGMKPTSWYSILRVFFRFAPMGKVEKTRFERNWTTFVNPAFCPAWKSLLKMVVWNRPRGIRS